jgi:predicted signal transduction protein with EAL and GGDEF domain
MQFEGDGEPLSDDGPEIPVELVRTLLGLLRNRLGLDTAWLSSFRDGMQTFEVLDGDADAVNLSSGDRASLSDSYCVRVIDGRLPAIVPDTTANQTTDALPVTRELGLGAYVGVPVLSPTGAAIGMVCAVSREAKPYLADFDLRIVRQVADLIGTLIESPEKGPDTTAVQRAAIRKVVSQHDFEVVFQPVHDVASGKVMGVEALARFPRAPFRPDAFLAQAALMGLGIDLETAILARVISMVPRLPEGVFVAVNISPGAALVVP